MPFLESWIFYSCLNVVNHYDEALEMFPALKADPGFMAQYDGKKGELVDLARNQVCLLNPSNALKILISPGSTRSAYT
jgi:hypothetical protein